MGMTDKQTIPDVSHYSYRVMWSADDEEFVATCVESPSLSWLASTQSKALKGIDALVAEVVADLAASREEIPTPIADRRFSGKFNVRVGERLHRELTVQATEAGLSLNQYLVSRLSGAQ